MGIWDVYESRVCAQGKTKREAALFRTSRRLREKLPDSLSYHNVIVDGEERSVIIDDSDNLNEKIMHSLPGEDFTCGGLVEWADNHWLIAEKDANTELRTRVKLLQCNFLLNGSISAEQFESSFRSIKATVTESSAAIRAAGENTTTLGDRFSGLASKFSSWLSVTYVIMTAIRTVKQMVSAATEVESAMAQIQIVTGASDSQMESFLTNSIALAKELGQSVTDVASSIETFARLGYNISDSSNLAKYANIMANVGNTDVDTATTGITSIIKGYEMDASDAEHVSDVLVKVGQEYAISAEELMAAFQRGGAALHASGTDFEKSAALFAATNASLQNAETTGTMWKTVSARIRGATTELEEMGEETDGLAQGLSKYREEIMALSGVDIMKDENTYKDMYDIFVQLAEVWDNMEDVSQSRVAEILGGTRNTSGIMSTITNIKDAIGAYASAMDSAGTATEANNIYMDTTKAKVGELKAAFQEFSSDVFDSDFTKGAVDALRGIVEAIDKVISTFGSLKTILVGLGIAKIIKNVA